MSVWTDDELGGTVWSEDEAAGTALGAATGSSLVGFLQSGSGATTRNVQDKNRDIKCVFDFFTQAQVDDVRARTGLVNVKAAITTAFAAHKHLLFPDGLYYVGDVSAAESIFGEINGNGGPVTVATEGLPKFKCNTTDNSIPVFFYISDAIGVQIGDVEFQDTGFDRAVSFKGASGIDLIATDNNPVRKVVISSIYATNMVAPLRVGNKSTTRVAGVKVGLIWADDCLYGTNLVNNGDSVKIDKLYANACIRSSYVYGVEDYEANIFSNSPRAASADCLISSGLDTGYDTTGVKIKYAARNTSNATALVSCQAFGENSRRIENIELDLDIDSSTAADVLSFRAYNAGGTVENTGATNNVFDAIKVRGRVSATGDHAHIYCQPSTKGSINIQDGFTRAKLDASMITYFNHTKGTNNSGDFTPTVVGSSSAGAGTYTTQLGRYELIGNRCFFEINLDWSAHTGTGNLQVGGLPFTSNATVSAPVNAVYSGITLTAGEEIGAAVLIGEAKIQIYSMDPSGGTIASAALDTAGLLYLSGHYEIA